MAKIPPLRRRGGRRKGERPVRVYDTQQLMALFDCVDREALIAKMHSLGLRPHVSLGDGFVADSDYGWPDDLRTRGIAMFPSRRGRGSDVT